MKKMVICICLIISVLTACQPTPDNQAVINKDDLGEMIMQTADPQVPLNIPGEWKEALAFQNGVQVNINAKIDLPAVTSFPVLEVNPHELTIEETQAFVDFFMQGKPLYKNEYVRTKAEIAQDIIDVQALVEKAETEYYASEAVRQSNIDMYNTQLSQFEEEYRNAPDEAPAPEPTSVYFEEIGEDGVNRRMQVKAYSGDTSFSALGVVIYENLESSMLFKKNDALFYKLKIETTDALTGLNITRQEAQAKAEETLEDLGIVGFQLCSTEAMATVALMDTSETIADAATDPDRKRCFVFHFCPTYNGISIPAFEPCFGYGIDSEGGRAEAYSRPLDPEDITISVDDSGVIEFHWVAPGDMLGVINSNAQLKDFQQIQEIFKNQMFYQRTWTDVGTKDNKITIKTVRLSLMRVKVKDKDNYMLLPVWDFIGDWTRIENTTDVSTENVSFLTINAIDGSIIDRNLGY